MDKKKVIFCSIKKSVLITIILMILCGLVFPLALTGMSALIFPKQAKGNLIEVDGKAVGSATVGQEFTEPYFMKGRPSAVHYNTYTEKENGEKVLSDGQEFTGPASGSANYAPTNPELVKRVERDMQLFLEQNPNIKKEDIPADLLTASGSGLDPHISPEAALVQIPAISDASGISEENLEKIVDENTNKKLFGIFGEETVNVLKVNLRIAQKMGILQ